MHVVEAKSVRLELADGCRPDKTITPQEKQFAAFSLGISDKVR